MLKYCLKRLLLAVVTMLVVTAVTFFAMNAVPGGPFDSEKAPSPAVMAVLNERYNLDKPVGVQFVLYLQNLLHGDFGVSIKTGRNISTIIADSFLVSAKLGWKAIVTGRYFCESAGEYQYPMEDGYYSPSADLSLAREMLASIGFAFGEDGKLTRPVTVEYLYNAAESNNAVAACLQADLAQLECGL